MKITWIILRTLGLCFFFMLISMMLYNQWTHLMVFLFCGVYLLSSLAGIKLEPSGAIPDGSGGELPQLPRWFLVCLVIGVGVFLIWTGCFIRKEQAEVDRFQQTGGP